MTQFNTQLYQSQQLKQEMRINPRLYQAMELLYMPLLDLQQHLRQELAENPFLEMTEPDAQQEVELKEEPEPEKEKEKDEGIDWEEILLDGFDAGGRRPQYEDSEFYEPTVVKESDLRDYLEEQLNLLDLSERELRLGEEIIGNVDDSGMLSCRTRGGRRRRQRMAARSQRAGGRASTEIGCRGASPGAGSDREAIPAVLS